MNTEPSLTGLARRLVSDNLIDESAAFDAIENAVQDKIPFVRYLIKNKILDSNSIAKAASNGFGLPMMSLAAFDTMNMPTDLVDNKLIKKHQLLPLLQRGNKLFLGSADPSNESAVDEIKFHTGIRVEIIILEDDKLNLAIEAILKSDEETVADFSGLDDVNMDDLDVEIVDQDRDDNEEVEAIDETPIVRFVNKILLDAIKTGASDIHIEPYEKVYRVRYRQDGILKEIARPPLNIANRICSRIKIMSQMDISERRIPQDGRIKMKLSKTRAIDFRVNTLPTLWGEKIVLRILDPTSAQLGIDALGFEPSQKQIYLNALNQHQGLILVTGPTGSGKTVSLYTGLNILNTQQRNISTAEDPVEINLEGVNQVAVNPKVGLDFSSALRAFLRQDPDVVMVGEIRDIETAEISIKAAQTGHLVLSTLHTNSAPETLSRLQNMGVPAYNVATSVTIIIAQRLARRLCSHCKKPLRLPPKVLYQEGFTDSQLKELELFTNVGCDKCNDGYKGRVGIYEVVPITDSISRIIMDNGNSIQIADKAREEGFNDLRASALEKVAQGLTSLAEANRVT